MEHLFATDRVKRLAPAIREFVEQTLHPQETILLQSPFYTIEPRLKALRNEVKAQGWFGMHLPESLGGLGLGLVEFAQLSKILATSPFGHYVFNCQAPDIGNMELLHQFASPAQQQEYLQPLVKGQIRSCFSMTEPAYAGSNPVLMGTTAVKQDGQYVINGHKWFTTAADGARFAVVMALTDPSNPNPYQRASLILVPTETPGFQLVRNIPIMGEAGEGYMSHAEIRYENCKVPLENLISKEGSGFALAQERLGPGRIHHCMRWIGICERALALMCQRAIAREIAPGVPLASKQTIQNWVAESKAGIMAARLMVLHTAYQMEKEGAKAVREEISTIKFYVAGVLQQVLDHAIQVHGALGITEDTVLSHWYRHERGARIYDGPDEVHKTVVAKGLFKKWGLKL